MVQPYKEAKAAGTASSKPSWERFGPFWRRLQGQNERASYITIEKAAARLQEGEWNKKPTTPSGRPKGRGRGDGPLAALFLSLVAVSTYRTRSWDLSFIWLYFFQPSSYVFVGLEASFAVLYLESANRIFFLLWYSSHLVKTLHRTCSFEEETRRISGISWHFNVFVSSYFFVSSNRLWVYTL